VCGLHRTQGDEERGFLSLSLKTGSYGLVIWASKSPQRFVGSSLKTKRTTIYQLQYKTDRRMKTA
jgi:hypothetical protein